MWCQWAQKCSIVTKVHQPPTWRSQGKVSSRKRSVSESKALPQAVITGHMVPLPEWEFTFEFQSLWPCWHWYPSWDANEEERYLLTLDEASRSLAPRKENTWSNNSSGRKFAMVELVTSAEMREGFVFVGHVCLRGHGANVMSLSRNILNCEEIYRINDFNPGVLLRKTCTIWTHCGHYIPIIPE